jgi:hypothetical protein
MQRPPARGPQSTDPSTGGEPSQSYDVLLYTDLPIFSSGPAIEPPPGQPKNIAGRPLAAVEQITVAWSRYEEYLAHFLSGARSPSHMRSRLLKAMSPGLEYLFSDRSLADQPVRLWWASETPELVDLPWELLVYGSRSNAEELSFVRGLPPETPTPQIPVGEQLRLAIIHAPGSAPEALRNALAIAPPGLHVTFITGSPLMELQRALREGYELIHLVADGLVSLAYEGILYLPGPPGLERRISPSQLKELLHSSRVALIGLTTPEDPDPDTIALGGRSVPSAYRAFAYLGSSTLSLPSVVAPLGPLEPEQIETFWRTFYAELADTLHIEEAMARARVAALSPPGIALFLHHSHGRVFRRIADAGEAPSADPSQLDADLQLSRELTDQLTTMEERYGTPPESVAQFVERERARQDELADQLKPWVQPEGGDA